jgi:hypothetical protein
LLLKLMDELLELRSMIAGARAMTTKPGNRLSVQGTSGIVTGHTDLEEKSHDEAIDRFAAGRVVRATGIVGASPTVGYGGHPRREFGRWPSQSHLHQRREAGRCS